MIEMFSYFIIVMNFEYDIFSHFRVAIPAIPATFLKKENEASVEKGIGNTRVPTRAIWHREKLDSINCETSIPPWSNESRTR